MAATTLAFSAAACTVVTAFALVSTACGGGDTEGDGTGTTGETTGGGETGGEGTTVVHDGPAPSLRVNGRNFSIPLPGGYERITRGTIADMMRAEVLDLGGVILMAEASTVAGATPGSIVVSPTVSDLSSDAVDDSLCTQVAELLASQHSARVERAGMVSLPWGSTCQWELATAEDSHRRRIGTMFAANAEDWIVTCHADVRDERAHDACNQVLSGWAFE